MVDAFGVRVGISTCKETQGSARVYLDGKRNKVVAGPLSGQAMQWGAIQMLNLIVTLLIIGLIAAVLGFGGIAGASFALAKVIFFIVLILFLLSIVFGTVRRPLL